MSHAALADLPICSRYWLSYSVSGMAPIGSSCPERGSGSPLKDALSYRGITIREKCESAVVDKSSPFPGRRGASEVTEDGSSVPLLKGQPLLCQLYDFELASADRAVRLAV